MKKLAQMITVSICLACSAAQADERKVDFYYYSGETYPDFESIPLSLRFDTMVQPYIERVLMSSLMRARAFDKEETGYLSQDGLKQYRDLALEKARRKQYERLVEFDQNYDGVVTREEILALAKGSVARKQDRVERYMKADTDGDGVITTKEMSTHIPGVAGYVDSGPTDVYKQFLSLDPNQDGRFTLEEMYTLQSKAFATLDTDGNGMISENEHQDAVEAKRQETRKRKLKNSP